MRYLRRTPHPAFRRLLKERLLKLSLLSFREKRPIGSARVCVATVAQTLNP